MANAMTASANLDLIRRDACLLSTSLKPHHSLALRTTPSGSPLLFGGKIEEIRRQAAQKLPLQFAAPPSRRFEEFSLCHSGRKLGGLGKRPHFHPICLMPGDSSLNKLGGDHTEAIRNQVSPPSSLLTLDVNFSPTARGQLTRGWPTPAFSRPLDHLISSGQLGAPGNFGGSSDLLYPTPLPCHPFPSSRTCRQMGKRMPFYSRRYGCSSESGQWRL